MKNYLWKFIAAFTIVGALGFLGINNDQTFAQSPETVYVTSPAEGETVTGLITVTGAADFPDFNRYEIFLKSGDQLSWAANVYAPVINGNLAFIDTRTFIDGRYQVVIRQVNSDSNYTDFIGPTFTIENNLGAPVFYAERESSPLYSPVNGAVVRLRNCSGHNLEFDYGSPDSSFCSSGEFWIDPKNADSNACPSVDFFVTACRYRGSAVGQGQTQGTTYEFTAEVGKIYQMDFAASGSPVYIIEIEGDERASTDTGHLDPDDPNRAQTQPEADAVETSTENSAAVSDTSDTAEDTTEETTDDTVAAPTPSADAEEEEAQMLPVTGQDEPSNLLFIIVGGGIILFLIIGGIVASRNRSYSI
ncbi:MAG: hypothetical protein AAF485_14235 [Chloroflexota bacterium]